MPALITLALAPAWASRFEANSYGFRPGRGTMEAMTALHTGMHRQGARQRGLDADMKGCLDHIDHAAWLQRLPVFTTTVRRWLQAGVVALGHYSHTEAGTPQGGVASPLLANMALDGMERLCDGEDTQGNPQGPSWKTGPHKGLSLMRYADDLVVVAPAREVLEPSVLPTLARFLADRGLRLSEAKTRMVQSTDGVNVLGCESRRFPRALLTQPQKAKMLGHSRTLTAYLHQPKQSPAVQVIHDLNPKRRGWGNSYRHCAAKRAFRKLDHFVWHALWRWAKRRHPNTSAPWVSQRDCRPVGHRQGVCAAAKAPILWYQDIPITRDPKVRGKSSPMHPALKAYGAPREPWRQKTLTIKPQSKSFLPTQDCRCGLGKVPFYDGDPIDDHHITPKHKGGEDRQENRRLVHRWCHHAHHQRHGEQTVGA